MSNKEVKRKEGKTSSQGHRLSTPASRNFIRKQWKQCRHWT